MISVKWLNWREWVCKWLGCNQTPSANTVDKLRRVMFVGGRLDGQFIEHLHPKWVAAGVGERYVWAGEATNDGTPIYRIVRVTE